jgi:hypothetical protein
VVEAGMLVEVGAVKKQGKFGNGKTVLLEESENVLGDKLLDRNEATVASLC